jgi:hypothetical protein
VHTFLHDDAGDFSAEDEIGKEKTTSDSIWRTKSTNDDTEYKNRSEEDELLARVIRSSQEFDDDAEISSSN